MRVGQIAGKHVNGAKHLWADISMQIKGGDYWGIRANYLPGKGKKGSVRIKIPCGGGCTMFSEKNRVHG